MMKSLNWWYVLPEHLEKRQGEYFGLGSNKRLSKEDFRTEELRVHDLSSSISRFTMPDYEKPNLNQPIQH